MLFGYCSTVEYCKQVADTGFDYIELYGREITALDEKSFFEVKKNLEALGLPCRGFAVSVPPEVRLCGPGYDRDIVSEYAKRCCARGAALGILHIGIGSPSSRNLPDGFDMDLAYAQIMEALQIFCAEARPYNINILLESVSSPLCNFVTRFPEASAVVEQMNIDNLYLLLDLYHLAVMDETLADYQSMLGNVKHVHIADKADNGQLRYENEQQYRQ